MSKIAVLTSGGDAPGMNAAISAVVRRGLSKNLEVYGIKYGYSGLIKGEIVKLDYESTEGIISQGGTVLKSARCEEFKFLNVQKRAIEVLHSKGIKGLVVIGGNGSLKGAESLSALGFPVVGIPGSIDNDVPGTDFSIGFDSAVNVVIDAIDKIRYTAASIGRIIIIEVMGRKSGDIALWSGIGADAESIIIPEVDFNIEHIIKSIQDNQRRNKMDNIIVLAEGVCSGEELKNRIEAYLHAEIRVMTLGYLQRGGSPSALDRMIASKMGVGAVDLLCQGKKGLMVGIKNNQLRAIPFEEAYMEKHCVDLDDYYLADSMRKRFVL